MSKFVMERIDQCFLILDDFVFEVMSNGKRKYKSIHGEPIFARNAFASPSLYRLLDMKMIARVGDYYYRQSSSAARKESLHVRVCS